MALVKFESSTLLPRLDAQQFHPILNCQIFMPVLLKSRFHPSPYPPLFQPNFLKKKKTYKSLFKQRGTLSLKDILSFFPIPFPCPFPSRNHPHVLCLFRMEELPFAPAHPFPPGLQITSLMVPLALQLRLKKGGSKQLWINNANNNGGVMNINY